MPALYVHVPFCRRKCPYCDFYSVPEEASLLDAYPELLIKNLHHSCRSGWNGPLETVFFGGGTPSLLSPAAVGRIMEGVQGIFGLKNGAEVSLEANPGTVSAETLEGYREAGINRISLGVQSLRERDLSLLGRIHSSAEARSVVRWAREAGFSNLSCDLIFALPDQTPEDLRRSVEEFLLLEPEHLSCYGLTVEDDTPFAHLHRTGELNPPDEERFSELFLLLEELLSAAGYGHYEISNYARPGMECRHNLRYWHRRSYLGIGAGSHSFCSRGWGSRSAVPSDLSGYMRALGDDRDPCTFIEAFDRRGAMAETLYLGLRTAEGVREDDFRRRFGAGVGESFPEAVERAGETLAFDGTRWRFHAKGWLLYDHLIAPFL